MVTLSNPYKIGTEIIEQKKSATKYCTSYGYTYTSKGRFWMKSWYWEASNGFTFDATGTRYDKVIENEYFMDNSSQDESYIRWWSDNPYHVLYVNINLRNGKNVTSNSLIFNGESISVSSNGDSSMQEMEENHISKSSLKASKGCIITEQKETNVAQFLND